MGCKFEFEPIKFLRTHSKNKDNADVQTQVWDCAIEPEEGRSFYRGAKTVATCGGNSICFIDCFTGTVLAKYYTKNTSTSLFSLAWTSLLDSDGRRNILAAGGSKCTVLIFDSEQKQCVLEEDFKSRRTVTINALQFHKTEKRILFCGSSDGFIRVCELQTEGNKKLTFSLVVNHVISTQTEIFDISFCLSTKFLLASSNSGLHTFYFPTKESLRTLKTPGQVQLSIEGSGRASSSGELVDSVEVLRDGLLAVKYALHGSIYICDLALLKSSLLENKKIKSFHIEPLYVLKWSDTDNYFMYMGVSLESQVLSCGDDRGSIWLYDLSPILQRSGEKEVSPSAIIPWPNVIDHYNDKKRKLDLETYDIVLDKVAVHSSGAYVVAVTNNNLVCLWKKV